MVREGGLETNLTFSNTCTKWLLSESFTTQKAAALCLQKSRNSRDITPWNHALKLKQEGIKEGRPKDPIRFLYSLPYFIQNLEHQQCTTQNLRYYEMIGCPFFTNELKIKWVLGEWGFLLKSLREAIFTIKNEILPLLLQTY